MKKIIAVLVAALTFGMASPSNAIYDPTAQLYTDLVSMNRSYAEQVLYCDSKLRFTSYTNAVFFDNNGSCIDPSPLVFGNEDLQLYLEQNYPGGMNQWTVFSDSGKYCEFELIQLHPHANEYLVWETFFTACAVRLNEDVNVNWLMRDTGSQVSPEFTGCTTTEQVGMFDSCLDTGLKPQPSNPQYLLPGTVDYINAAAKLLKKKFYFDFKAWVVYNKKLKSIRTTLSKYPAGTKIYLQKWVDYKWVTVRTSEYLWEGKSFSDYKLVSGGKYRVIARSITGKVWQSKTVLV